MNVVKHFFSSFLQMLMCVAWAHILHKIELMRVVTCVLNGELSGLKDWIVTSGYIFICLFCIMGGLFFLGLSLFHLFMVYYYAFVNDNRVIHVAVDENDVIQDTFLELSNGKIIPIKITKLKMDKLKEEVGEQ